MILTENDTNLTPAEKRERRERDRRLHRALKRRESMSDAELRAEEARLEREIAFRLLTGRVTVCPPQGEAFSSTGENYV